MVLPIQPKRAERAAADHAGERGDRQQAAERLEGAEETIERARHALRAGRSHVARRAGGEGRDRPGNREHEKGSQHQPDAPAELARVALEGNAHRRHAAQRQRLQVVVAAMHEAGREQRQVGAAKLAALEGEARDRWSGLRHHVASTIPASTAAPIQLACMNARKQPSRVRPRISHQWYATSPAATARPRKYGQA